MNKIFRRIWNLLLLALPLPAAMAQQAPAPTAVPSGGKVVAGQAGIQQQGATLTVKQTSDRAAIDWASFDVGSQAQLRFDQPSAQSVTLNRVQGAGASQIFGRINANGQVFLSNPNGVFFAPGASVDVGGLVATTHRIGLDEFMAARVRFERAGATGSVVNEGELRAALGGYVALLAPEVRNQGLVVANLGTVALAAGEAFELRLDAGRSLAALRVEPGTMRALVDNRSAVLAPGGLVILSARALDQVQGGVIRHSARAEATSLVDKGGRIVLEAEHIELAAGSRLDASGAAGGGTVLVGGDWQGSGDMAQARSVDMAPGARIDADATRRGDGGTVVLWADAHREGTVTHAHGSISARGGSEGGNGGRVETSGHHLDTAGAMVDTRAAQGRTGLWLLDPNTVTVAASGGNTTGAAIAANLATSNVTIQTGNTAVGDEGDIVINDDIAYTGSAERTLTFKAHNDITLGSGRTISSSAAPLNTVLRARSHTSGAPDNGAVAINGNIHTHGGGLWVGGGSGDVLWTPYAGGTAITVADGAAATWETGRKGVSLTGASISTGAGNVRLAGLEFYSGNQPAGAASGVLVRNSSIATSSGNIDINGVVGGVFNTAAGVDIQANGGNTTLETGSGAITISGSGDDNNTNGSGWRHGIRLKSETAGSSLLIRSNSGAIALNGAASFTDARTTDTSGLQFQSDTTTSTIQVVSQSGDISLEGSNTQQGGQQENAIRFSAADAADSIRIGYGGSHPYSGNILVEGDSLLQSNQNAGAGSIAMQTSGTLTIQSAGSRFSALRAGGGSGALSFDDDWNFGTHIASFTLGKPTNDLAYTFANNLSANGAISLHGANVIDGNLTSTATGDIFIKSVAAAEPSLWVKKPIAKTAGTGTLTLRSTGRTWVEGAISATGTGKLDTVIWSDHDGTQNDGGVGIGANVSTNGGHLWMGAGAQSSAPWNGLTVGSAPSTGSSGHNHNAVDLSANIDTRRGSDGTGGDVLIWAGNGVGAGSNGILPNGNRSIQTGSGNLTLRADRVGGGNVLSITAGSFSYEPNGSAWQDVGTTLNVDGSLAGNTFTGSGDVAWLELNSVSSMTGLAFGKEGNTSGIASTVPWSINGSIGMIGGPISVDAALTAAGDITLKATSADNLADVLVNAPISNNAGVASTLDIQAERHIQLGDAASVTASNAAMTTNLRADTNQDGDGIVVVKSSGISTHGGALRFGDAAQTATLNGQSVRVGGDVFFNKSTAQSLNTGGGALDVWGETIVANTAGLTVDTGGGNVGFHGVLNSGNGYAFVDKTGDTAHDWDWARTDAKNSTAGASAVGDSYLVSIGSRLENSIAGLTAGYRGAWIGAWRQNPNNHSWQWADGPAAGTTFFTQAGTSGGGAVAAGAYANFGPAEPNGVLDPTRANTETVGQFYGTNGQWNDLRHTTQFSATQSGQHSVLGYVRETNLGNSPLTVNAGSGAVTFGGAVGGSKALAALNVTAASTTVNGNALVTAGAQTYNNSLTVNATGDLRLDASSISVTNANQALRLAATGNVTQTGAIFADQLRLSAGNVTLINTSNNVGTLAASGVGALSYVDSNALTIGSVDATHGVSAGGAVSITTRSGNLTLAKSVSTSNTTAGAVVLNADASKSAGDSSGGNLIVDGGAAVSVGAGGAARLYSGSVAGSTGLTDLVGSGSGRFRYRSDEATANYSTALATGVNAIYREQPSVSATGNAAAMTYGGAVPTLGLISGLQNGDSVNFSVSGRQDSSSGNIKAGSYSTAVDTSGLAALGYAVTNNSGGSLAVATKSIAAVGITASNKGYDGSKAATLSNTGSVVGAISGDAVNLDATGANVEFADKNAGNGKIVTIDGLLLSGSDAGNYTLASNSASTTADIAKATIGAVSGIGANDKTYDGTTGATLNSAAAAFVGMVSGDDLSVSAASGAFGDRNAGNGKNVAVTGITLAGTDAGNYTLASTTANATASIHKAGISAISGIGAGDKTYDGSTGATLNTASAAFAGMVGGDDLNVAGANGAFADKNAGAAKPVHISGIALAGADAGNYTLASTTASATATIHQAAISAVSGISAYDKTYDGNTGATLNTASAAFAGMVSGDDLNVASANGAFADKNAASGKTVSISGITLGGLDAGNYSVPGSTTTTAGITPKPLSISGLTASGKTYDGSTDVTVTGWGSVNTGVAGETLTLTATAASFDTATAGSGKAVTASGYTLGDRSGLAGNYRLASTSATTRADIARAVLTVTARDDAKFVTLGDTPDFAGVHISGFVGGETAAVLGGSASVTRSNAGVETAGRYNGVLVPDTRGLITDNYSFATQAGSFTIVPSNQLLVRVADAHSVYASAATYTLSSAAYFDGSTVHHLPLPGAANADGSFTLNDGAGATAKFSVLPSAAALSGAGLVPVGSHALAASGLWTDNPHNFNNSFTIVGLHTVAPKSVSVGNLSAVSKVYDGTTTMAGVHIGLSGLVAGDDVGARSSSGAFDSKNAGTGLGYTIGGIALAGSDAGNYQLGGATSASGNDGVITPRPLHLSFGGVNKVYDGNATASVTSQDDRISGDQLSIGRSATFSDKNVGSGKAVSISGVALSGPDAQNYSLPGSVGATRADITRLDSVAWIGGASGNWFDPANWAGGAVPDLSNVANVVIAAPAVVSFDPTAAAAPAQAGPVVIDSLGSNGGLVQSGGSLAVGAGGVTLGSFAQTGGSTTTQGNLRVSGPFTQSGQGSVAVGGNATIDNPAGGVTLGNLATAGNLNVTANGTIGQAGGSAIHVAGRTALDAGSANVVLDGTANDFVGAVEARGRDITLVDGSGGLTLGNVIALGTLNATSTGGDIAQAAGSTIRVWGRATLGSSSGVIALVPSGNQFAVGVTLSGPGGAVRVDAAPVPLTPAAQQTLPTPASAPPALGESGFIGDAVQLRLVALVADEPAILTVTVAPGVLPSGFSFALPASLIEGQRADAEITATLADGAPLPAWLRFDREGRRFVVSAVPADSLPLRLAVTVGAQRTVVVLTKASAVEATHASRNGH